jgi:hypothetical protein
VRARHSAEGTADAEKAVGRTNTAEQSRENIKYHNDSGTASRVLRHYYQKFLFGKLSHVSALLFDNYIILFII